MSMKTALFRRRSAGKLSRRLIIRGFIGFGLANGMNTLGLSGQTSARAQACCEDDTLKLDGEYLVDEAARRSVSSDYGRTLFRLPLAVARPQTTADIMRIVERANAVGLKVAVRGQGHSLSGQALVDAGIVIDSSSLKHVDPASNGTIDVQAGALWGDVASTSLAQGQLPPVMPDALMLSVGGTLSVGGIGETSYRFGAQVDQVRELDVVTGSGEFVTCSEISNPELFAMMLAGLGQCGIIVRARLNLNRAERFVVTQTLRYEDVGTLLSDQARLTQFAELGPLNGRLVRAPNGGWQFLLTAGCFVPDAACAAQWAKDLRHSGAAEPVLLPIWEYLNRRTASIMAGKAQINPNPSLVLSLPAAVTGQFITEVIGSSELSAGIWFFEVSPKIPARHSRPLQKMPAAALGYELRMQKRASALKAVDHREMLLANQRLAARALDLGGKVYPPFAPILSAAQWHDHFGPATLTRFAAAKQRFDPNNVLNPGAGIF
jgi:cytokinin dehydrogenase